MSFCRLGYFLHLVYSQRHQKDMSGKSHKSSSFSCVFNTILVSAGIGGIRQRSSKDQARSNRFNIVTGQSSCSSLCRKIDTAHKNIQHYGGLNVSDTTKSIIVTPLRESTRKKYNPSQRNNIAPKITNVLDFLSNLHVQRPAYSVINSAKSALSSSSYDRKQNFLTTFLCHNMERCIQSKTSQTETPTCMGC